MHFGSITQDLGRLRPAGANSMGVWRFVCDLSLPDATGMFLIAAGLAVIDGRPLVLAGNGDISAG